METPDGDYKKEDYGERFSRNIHQDIGKDSRRKFREGIYNDSRSGRVLSGLFVMTLGVVFLAHEMGANLPSWLFRWPMILIAIGLFIGAKHSFRLGGWLALIVLGGAFLVDDILPDVSLRQYIWPLFIIFVGLIMILKPGNRWKYKKRKSWEDRFGAWDRTEPTSDDFIDSVSVFGGEKKNVISKDFKGGDIVIFFGGMELNLSQADLTKPTVIDVTQIFGGTKLVVPANWQIKSEVVTVFGSFEDKRPILKDGSDANKVLIIRGTCVFGAVDIKSY